MNKGRIAATAVLLLAFHPAARADTQRQPISLAAFSDGIKHWQDRHGTGYARYQPQQITEIADNLLLYQRDNGAWIENRDPARILEATEKAALVAEKGEGRGSFDNRNIYSQIDYLAAAFGRGDECVLRLQVVQEGKLTGWAGQYDPKTLQPAMGRTFELPSIVSQETVEMLRYLMSVQRPTVAQVNAIESAVGWLRRSQISGVRLEKVTLPKPVQYQYHVATFDYRLVDDTNAPPLWARFYDLEDNSVVLANRDSVRVKDYSEIHPERRSGYAWFGTWPAALLNEECPGWRVRRSAF